MKRTASIDYGGVRCSRDLRVHESRNGTGPAEAARTRWTQPHVLRFADAQDVNTLNPFFGQITARRLSFADDDGVAHQMGRA